MGKGEVKQSEGWRKGISTPLSSVTGLVTMDITCCVPGNVQSQCALGTDATW